MVSANKNCHKLFFIIDEICICRSYIFEKWYEFILSGSACLNIVEFFDDEFIFDVSSVCFYCLFFCTTIVIGSATFSELLTAHWTNSFSFKVDYLHHVSEVVLCTSGATRIYFRWTGREGKLYIWKKLNCDRCLVGRMG